MYKYINPLAIISSFIDSQYLYRAHVCDVHPCLSLSH